MYIRIRILTTNLRITEAAVGADISAETTESLQAIVEVCTYTYIAT